MNIGDVPPRDAATFRVAWSTIGNALSVLAIVVSVGSLVVSYESKNLSADSLALAETSALEMKCSRMTVANLEKVDAVNRLRMTTTGIDPAFDAAVGPVRHGTADKDGIFCTLRNYGAAPIVDVIVSFETIYYRQDQEIAYPPKNERHVYRTTNDEPPTILGPNGISSKNYVFFPDGSFTTAIRFPASARVRIPSASRQVVVPIQQSGGWDMDFLVASFSKSKSAQRRPSKPRPDAHNAR
jgi:hypothetical protein